MEYEVLNSLTVKLHGVRLVEAAAGTGKTYTIQNLVARLLLEKRFEICDMMILSFTNESTAELKDRIRTVIEKMIAVLENKNSSEQAAVLIDADRKRAPEVNDDERAKVLRRALRDFDNNYISTINGFCQKIISEYSFESGMLFNAEVNGDPKSKTDRLFLDWQRKRLYQNDRLFDALCAEECRKKDFCKLVKNFSADHTVEIRGGDDIDTILACINTLCQKLTQKYDAAEKMDGYLDGRCSQAKNLTKLIAALKDQKDTAAIYETAKLYSAEMVRQKANKKGKDVIEGLIKNEPEFFEICGRLDDLDKKILPALRRDAFIFVREQFEKTKKRENFITYDDQISLVCDALTRSSELQEKLQRKFKVGIIDEFQDTNIPQYRIFNSIFCNAEEDGRCAFLVGDPRQSIYGFRGGDLHTYLTVRTKLSEKEKICILDTNYRSSKVMVSAINKIFADHKLPFGDERLSFPELKSTDMGGLLFDGKPDEAGIERRHFPDADLNCVLENCAARISEYLKKDSPWKLPDGKPVSAGDIAVLVKEHKQAIAVYDALRRLDIPTVRLKEENLFKSEEAAEMYHLLAALVNPGNRKMVNSALSSVICGVSPSQLIIGSQGENGADDKRKILFAAAGLWQKGSFVQMFEYVMRKFNVRERLLRYSSGERRLCNIIQLADILHEISSTSAAAPETLLNELRLRIADSRYNEIEVLPAQESAAVKIMTIHGSKGLEFPIVMLPDLQFCNWNNLKTEVLHDDEGNRIIDLANIANPQLKIEERQESLRLAYVALTRAKYRCEVFEAGQCGNFSVLDYLFNPDDAEAVLNDVNNNLKPLPLNDTFYPVTILSEETVSEFFADEEIKTPVCPQKISKVDPDWRIVSFSSLSCNRSGIAESPLDHDAGDDDGKKHGGNNNKIRRFSPFDLPRGEGFGSAVHWIFENIDFAAPAEEFEKLLQISFNRFRISYDGQAEKEVVSNCAKWLHSICRTPLKNGDSESFTLADIKPADRKNELEFHCSLNDFDLKSLREALDDYVRGNELGLSAWPKNWEMQLAGGILNGFIDLFFRYKGKYYILDWKTNILDSAIENFYPEKLKSEMVHSMYFLQYLLYLVSVVRHLRRFNSGTFGALEYEKYFGGIYYLFVRGISPDFPGRGVFRARPSWQTVEKMESVLCGSKN